MNAVECSEGIIRVVQAFETSVTVANSVLYSLVNKSATVNNIVILHVHSAGRSNTTLSCIAFMYWHVNLCSL